MSRRNASTAISRCERELCRDQRAATAQRGRTRRDHERVADAVARPAAVTTRRRRPCVEIQRAQ